MYLFHEDSAYIASRLYQRNIIYKIFQGAARRAGITDTSVFLLGFDTIALQAEKTILLLTLKYILLH